MAEGGAGAVGLARGRQRRPEMEARKEEAGRGVAWPEAAEAERALGGVAGSAESGAAHEDATGSWWEAVAARVGRAGVGRKPGL